MAKRSKPAAFSIVQRRLLSALAARFGAAVDPAALDVVRRELFSATPDLPAVMTSSLARQIDRREAALLARAKLAMLVGRRSDSEALARIASKREATRDPDGLLELIDEVGRACALGDISESQADREIELLRLKRLAVRDLMRATTRAADDDPAVVTTAPEWDGEPGAVEAAAAAALAGVGLRQLLEARRSIAAAAARSAPPVAAAAAR